ncbi:GroES-like protein [Xylariaceae sp. FL0662B]|nr:GroES-like protein [Xylariaceae sp. FL0662B]
MDQTTPLTTASLPKTQTAIVANDRGDLIISQDAPLPELQPDMLLIKTVAVAVNPVDAKLTRSMASEGAVAGCDCAGVVLSMGPDVPTNRFAVGDRICAAVVPMNPLSPRSGAFAEYVGVTADFALKIPDDIPFESAATICSGIAAVGYASFHSLELPGDPEMPATEPAYVLIYGGSTATGTLAIQLVRRSGLVPITTCSPKNFALVESYGAEKAFDYHNPSSADEIRTYTKNALSYALDCFSEGTSMVFCYSAIGRAGGRYTALEPYPEHLHTRKRVKPEWILGPALLGKKIGWKKPYNIEANPRLRVFGRNWFLCVQHMLDRGELRTHPVRVGEKVGFEGILDGLELIRKKAVSGEKLVYRVANS